jgi:hypothetical protein
MFEWSVSHWINNEKILNFPDGKEHPNTMYQTLQDIAKTGFGEALEGSQQIWMSALWYSWYIVRTFAIPQCIPPRTTIKKKNSKKTVSMQV